MSHTLLIQIVNPLVHRVLGVFDSRQMAEEIAIKVTGGSLTLKSDLDQFTFVPIEINEFMVLEFDCYDVFRV